MLALWNPKIKEAITTAAATIHFPFFRIHFMSYIVANLSASKHNLMAFLATEAVAKARFYFLAEDFFLVEI